MTRKLQFEFESPTLVKNSNDSFFSLPCTLDQALYLLLPDVLLLLYVTWPAVCADSALKVSRLGP